VVPQRRPPGQGSGLYHFNPRSSRSLARPSFSWTLSQPQHRPVASLKDVINDLPSRNVAGEKNLLLCVSSPSGTHLGFRWGDWVRKSHNHNLHFITSHHAEKVYVFFTLALG
jgi:hypothetical protein